MTRGLRNLAAALIATAAACGTGLAETGKALVPAERAVGLFRAVCLGTVEKDFAGAAKVMAKYGIDRKETSGTIYSEAEDISFKIFDGPGFGKTCSMAFASKDKAKAVQAAVPKVAPFQDSAFGLVTVMTKGVLVIYKGTRNGGRMYHNLRMLSDRG